MKKENIINQSAKNTQTVIQKELPSMSMEVKNDGVTLNLSSGEIMLLMSMMLVLVLGTIAGMIWFANTLKGFTK